MAAAPSRQIAMQVLRLVIEWLRMPLPSDLSAQAKLLSRQRRIALQKRLGRLFSRAPQSSEPILDMHKLGFQRADAPTGDPLRVGHGIVTTAMLDQRAIGCLEQASPSRSPIFIRQKIAARADAR